MHAVVDRPEQMEQLAQKEEKRERMRTYSICRAVTGSWTPFWSQGCIVALNIPYTDETRIRLDVGDIVKVTRWKKYAPRCRPNEHEMCSLSITELINCIWHFFLCEQFLRHRHWMFGEKCVPKKKSKKNGISDSDSSNKSRIRGWFPRQCAVELVNPESDDDQNHFIAKKTS